MKRAIKKVLTIEARRNDLILATLRSIQKHGFQGSTIQTICEESGLSRGLVSHYFGGKDELLLAAFEYLTVRLDAEARRIVRGAGDDPFRRLLTASYVTFARKRAYHEVWLHFWSAALTEPAALQIHRNLWGRFRRSVERMMQAVVDDKQIQVDVTQSALMFTQMIDGLWLGWVLEKTYDLETCRKVMRDWLCTLFRENPEDHPLTIETQAAAPGDEETEGY